MKTIQLLCCISYLAIFGIALTASANDPQEPAWLPPLAEGSAPACPEHQGVRNFHSEIALYQGLTAQISGVSRRDVSACTQEASLLLNLAGRETRIPLTTPIHRDYSIIDFSPDNSHLLVSIDIGDPVTASDAPESQLLGLVDIAGGKLTTWSVWQVMGWKACDATVELQGFLPNGKPVIRARPSIWSGHPHPNCVSEPELYVFNPATVSTEKLDKATKVLRYGQEVDSQTESCKSDPDLVAQCFTVHGRLDLYNGGPSTRIWVVGTHHMLGVDREIVPENAAQKLDWDTDVYGDFLVCPLAREQKDICSRSVLKARTIYEPLRANDPYVTLKPHHF